jgi:integrase
MICFPFKPRRKVSGDISECRFYSGKLRLDGESRTSVIALHTTDEREAWRQLNQLRDERVMEARGLLPPRAVREAALKPLEELRRAFLEDVKARGRAPATLKRYEKDLRRLFERCGWRKLADITPQSFIGFRARSLLSKKSLNDMLAVTKVFLEWLRGQRMLKEKLLEFVKPVDMRGFHPCRRALRDEQVRSLLAVAPEHRRIVYLTALNTGARRKEMKMIRWGDFDLDSGKPSLLFRASIAKNRKDARIPFNDELATALRAFRPADAAPFQLAFGGLVPKMETLRRDLAKAGIVYLDEQGRRVDFHSLRMTFGTNLVLRGQHPRSVQEMMRHSDIRITMKLYTDVTGLPLREAAAALPMFGSRGEETKERVNSLDRSMLKMAVV